MVPDTRNGFSQVEAVNYDKNKLAYPGIVFGIRKNAVGNKHVLCAVFRGSTTNEDWITDLDAQLKDGFSNAGENSYRQLKEYMKKHGLTAGNTIFYITGHSYGAACANQAVQLGDKDGLMPEKSTFVYLFATPNNFLHRGSAYGPMKNVIHYINVEDKVPKVPVRADCGKTGRIIYLDYDRDLEERSRTRQARFDLCFKLLHGKYYCEEVLSAQKISKAHECHTYLSFLLSKCSGKEIFAFFGERPSISMKTAGKNKKATVYFSLPHRAAGGEIFFSEKKNGSYRIEATVKDETPLPMNGLKNGKTYYFKIRAFYRPVRKITVGPISGTKKLFHEPLYTEFSEPFAVTVKKVVSVKLDHNSLSMKRGETHTLKATKTGIKDAVTWSSSDPAVVSVSKKGTLTAKKAGKAKITAKAGGKKAACTVTVSNGVNLAKYYDMRTSAVKKAFPGGKWDSGRYAYIYRHICFSDDSTGSIYNIFWDGKTAGVHIVGIYVGMKKGTALKKLKSGGWRTVKEESTENYSGSVVKTKKASFLNEPYYVDKCRLGLRLCG